MKKFVLFKKLCYSKSLEMKLNIRFGLICTACVVGAAALVAGTTLGIVSYKNSQLQGQGGLDTPGLPELSSVEFNAEQTLLLSENDELLLEEDPLHQDQLIADNELNTELTYFSYRVKKGDMISVLAERFGITEDTLDSVNNITSARTLQIDSYLKVPSISGILYTVKNTDETAASIASSYEVDAERCALVNNITTDQILQKGTTIFVPDAKMDYWTRQEINGDLFHKPIHASFRYSSWFGYRTNPFDATRRTFHNGIDMACPKGTNIYAAQEGIVTTAGYSNVYGNYVIITHHSGYKTLYGHMTYYTVKKGQYVTTSTIIGKVGSTGQSTGPHLHFTIFKNDRAVNPANYW